MTFSRTGAIRLRPSIVMLFIAMVLPVFAAAIYGSLKCFQGSVVALLCGLGLAVLATAWESLRLLKD